MDKKESFAKLTEDLENLSKAEEPKAEEVVEAPKAEEVVEEVKEEKVAEEKAEEVVEPAQPEIPEVVPQVEAVPEVAPEPAQEEEVEKAAKCPDCGKPKADCKCGDDDDDDKKDDKKKDDKPVKKSEISETDFIGAFEAVVKSFSSVKEELASVKSEFASFMTFVKDNMVMKMQSVEPVEAVVEEEVAKSEEPVEGEEVSKSVEEEPEGKAVEFIAKSEDGVPVEEPVAEEEPKEFVPSEHVSTVTDYFMKHAHQLDPGRQAYIRAAVQRVKRGQAGQPDVDLFKEIVNFNENSEN